MAKGLSQKVKIGAELQIPLSVMCWRVCSKTKENQVVLIVRDQSSFKKLKLERNYNRTAPGGELSVS